MEFFAVNFLKVSIKMQFLVFVFPFRFCVLLRPLDFSFGIASFRFVPFHKWSVTYKFISLYTASRFDSVLSWNEVDFNPQIISLIFIYSAAAVAAVRIEYVSNAFYRLLH